MKLDKPQSLRRAAEKPAKARELLARGELGRAKALAEQALAENEADADSHSLLASILDRCGEWRQSLAHLRRAHELMAEEPQVRLNLAMALLRLGDYREGFALYEARLDKPAWSGFATVESRAANRGRLLRPGDPVAKKRIVLLAEQGLGDAIMCARYIPMLAQRGARIAIASNPTLRPFFAHLSGIETLLSPPPDQPLAQINLAALPFDAWLPLLSLPHWFGTDLNSVPAQIPYWVPEPSRVAQWRARLAASGRGGGPKIGLVFQANRSGAGFADKSLKVAQLAPLLALDGVDIVNLQYGPAGRELAAAAPGAVSLLPDELPLDDYGAAIAATDLLITVDTMAAHFSGAMGHPTWVAVPHSPHWVWQLTAATTPWYPGLHIFRQTRDRDWSDALAALAAELRRFISPRQSTTTDAGTGESKGRGSGRSRQRDRAGFMPPPAPSGSDAERLEFALAKLRRGEFEQGFADYEVRQRLPLWSEQALPLRESLAAVEGRRLQPGEAVSGRRIAVFTEQGLGDVFFGARFLAALAARGAAITLICREPMRPFFARLPFVDLVLSPPGDAPHAKIDLRKLAFDAFCPLLSLPYALGIAREPTLPRVPYVSADPVQVAAWRARYQRRGRPECRRVGVIWQANPDNVALAHRSMAAADLAPLMHCEGIELVNLQSGPAGRELAHVAPAALDVTQTPLPLDEFAAALAATDLVVSVDTMAAHCAGALGHPVYVVLTDKPAWYWGEAGDGCAWYPSARLFRRPAAADWSVTIAAVAAALRSPEAAPSAVLTSTAE